MDNDDEDDDDEQNGLCVWFHLIWWSKTDHVALVFNDKVCINFRLATV